MSSFARIRNERQVVAHIGFLGCRLLNVEIVVGWLEELDTERLVPLSLYTSFRDTGSRILCIRCIFKRPLRHFLVWQRVATFRFIEHFKRIACVTPLVFQSKYCCL